MGDGLNASYLADCPNNGAIMQRSARSGNASLMTRIIESAFIAWVEGLITELVDVREGDDDLRRRSHEALMEGYGRALALEGRCRQLRERQLELADLDEPDAGALRELTGLAQREARLGNQERELRAVLARLREASIRLADAALHETMPRHSA
jgi:hypothetical protein